MPASSVASASTSSDMDTTEVDEEFKKEYLNEQHILSFAQALVADDFVEYDGVDTPRTPRTPAGSATPASSIHGYSLHGHSSRIQKISALSDFAPVNIRVRKRRKGLTVGRGERKQEWMFVLVRWPLLLLVFLFISLEFGLYVFVRQCVNAKEWLTAWRGRKGELRKQMRAAQTYEEWKDAARALDAHLKFDKWKTMPEDPYYDWRLVQKVRRSLKMLREKDDARGVLGVLETCIRSNFAGIESSRLYSETFLGTKESIENYVTEVERALVYIRESTELSLEEKRRYFKSANRNYGISALCLSGGASFGYYHFGVIKAFVQAGLLPRVITGTSAGGLVAAFACTRTDEELKRLLVPALADKLTACEDSFRVWWRRLKETGARFDSVAWAKKSCFFTRGSLTFKEAYLRTGRILNVSVIPADRHSPTKLLNYLTAPDTVIWSALLASSAVPGILNPVVLMQKTREGHLIPWNWGSKFKDGSLRVDIPLQSLNLYFNVTYPVVSQVNPHVHLFFFAPRGSAGKPVAHRKNKGWRGNFLLSAAEQWLKLELTKNFKFLRDLDLLPQLLGQDWSSVFLQRFDGTVTIWPRTRIRDWFSILSDPDREELGRKMWVGSYVTWPKLHMIENRLRIEREIFHGRKEVRKQTRARDRVPTLKEPAIDAGELPDASVPPTSPDTSGLVRPPLDSILAPGADSDDSDSDTVQLRSPIALRNGLRGIRDAISGSSTPRDVKTKSDPLRSPSLRRRWTTEFLAGGDDEDGPLPNELGSNSQSSREADPPLGQVPESLQRLEIQQPNSFLMRLSSGSLSGLAGGLRSPFSGFTSMGKRRSMTPTGTEDMWSSESEDLEDELLP